MRYEKYIGCEFGYTDIITNESITLILTDIIKRDSTVYYDECSHCKKPLKTTIYTFTRSDSGQNEEYIFGSECVKHVIQAGLV